MVACGMGEGGSKAAAQPRRDCEKYITLLLKVGCEAHKAARKTPKLIEISSASAVEVVALH